MEQSVCSEKLPCNRRGGSKSRKTIKSRAWEPKLHAASNHSPQAKHEKIVFAALVIAALVYCDIFWWRTAASTIGTRNDDIALDENDVTISHLRHAKNHNRQHHHNKQTTTHMDTYEFELIPTMADAVVVGSGLAGLTAALTILDRGGTVLIFEKESILGGNSNKASSGINACCLPEERWNNDTIALFRQDTVKSAGKIADMDLIDTLIDGSAEAITWFHERIGIDLSVLAQLGGHSRKRTHRPQWGFVGAEIMTAMETAVRAFERTGHVGIFLDTQVRQIIANEDGKVIGVVSESQYGEYGQIRCDHVVLATGGFASDRSRGSYLEKYRPELLSLPATAGAFSTGDGIAMAESIGASTRHMDKIQLHPTGFVDPSDPHNPNRILAAEMLRGVGGILINQDGERFCNELGKRDYVSEKMLSQTQHASISRLWNLGKETPIFYLLLSKSAAQQTKHHLAVYSKKGLVSTIHGVDNLSKHLQIPTPVLEKTIQDYQLEASQGIDKYGKTMFENVPVVDLNTETFVVGAVGPALHYCMGGITIDTEGNVMKENGTLVEGLHGAGEVTGGVHGENRLGGNSLLECAVFGSIVGKKIPVDDSRERTSHKTAKKSKPNKPKEPLQQFSMEEIAEHTLPKDCWVALHGRVYDLSDFIEQHPGGLSSILSLAGTDGTKFFDGVHSSQILERLSRHVVGVLKTHPTETKTTALKVITQKELKNHASNSDVWVAIHGVVYDLTEFSQIHPGGSYLIQKLAGKDGTEEFQVFHEAQKLEMIQKHALGRLQDTAGMNTFLQTMK